MEKGIRMTVDGTTPELVKDILETDLMNHVEDNKKTYSVLGKFRCICTCMWGMVGTLLGLINMMKAMGTNPDSIGEGMSLALITTLYGSILANWICIPIAAKLRKE